MSKDYTERNADFDAGYGFGWHHACIFGLLVAVYCLTKYDFTRKPDTTAQPTMSAMQAQTLSAAPTFKSTTIEVEPMNTEEKDKDFDRRDYINRYAGVAIAEMNKYGIPASITLAQGIHETAAGTSRLAKEAKNHFGIKCFSRKCKEGHCIRASDDSHKDFFFNYESVWESYRHHSKFLKNGSRYSGLFELDRTDYKGWAHGLQNAGYATSPTYAKNLIRIIELYNLHQFDQ